MHAFKDPGKENALGVQPELTSESSPGEQFGGGRGGPPRVPARIKSFELKLALVVGLVLLTAGAIGLSANPANVFCNCSISVWLEGVVFATGLVTVLVVSQLLFARYGAQRFEAKAPGVKSLTKKRLERVTFEYVFLTIIFSILAVICSR